MAFDTYTSAPQVYETVQPSTYDRISYQSGSGVINKRRTVTESVYAFTALTKAAADAGAATIMAADTADNTTATSMRDGPGNLWRIRVTATAYGAFDTY